MTRDSTFDETISTAHEFEAVLGEVLTAAAGNGFDPEGSWVYRSDGYDQDWEVMVVELEKESESG